MENNTAQEKKKVSEKSLILLMAISCGIIVANLYYNQPLLADIAKSLGVSQKATGLIPTLTQLGYASGLLLIVPLIDMVENKKLMLIMITLSTIALLLMSVASTVPMLYIVSYALGLTSVVPQMLIPIASTYATDKNRGKLIGFMMTGLLSGILLSRAFSGFINDHLGWQWPFIIAAGLNVLVFLLIVTVFPKHYGTHSEGYGKLLRSLVHLFVTLPKLRKSSFIMFLSFGVFSMLWSIMSFYLSAPPFNYSTGVIGLFSILAVGGAVAANISGRYADKKGSNFTLNIGIICLTAGYLALLINGHALLFVVLSVLLSDFGHQTNHISNQSIILALSPTSRGRMNTVYMTFMFTGGAAGSTVANYAWNAGGIHLVSLCAVGLSVLAYLIFRFWKTA
ncbi:MFS transporter [Chitinophagaceae bacterium LWZ2-11]